MGKALTIPRLPQGPCELSGTRTLSGYLLVRRRPEFVQHDCTNLMGLLCGMSASGRATGPAALELCNLVAHSQESVAPLAFRIPGELMKNLQHIADGQARASLRSARFLLTIGTEAYNKEGAKYLQAYLGNSKIRIKRRLKPSDQQDMGFSGVFERHALVARSQKCFQVPQLLNRHCHYKASNALGSLLPIVRD
jgi:hypothetical protein